MTDNAAILRELALVKVAFQLRTIEAVMGIPMSPNHHAQQPLVEGDQEMVGAGHEGGTNGR